MCIRAAIANERRAWEAKEAKKKAAADEGKEYESDDEAPVGMEEVPFITKKMFLNALEHTRRCVSKADLDKYMQYKVRHTDTHTQTHGHTHTDTRKHTHTYMAQPCRT